MQRRTRQATAADGPLSNDRVLAAMLLAAVDAPVVSRCAEHGADSLSYGLQSSWQSCSTKARSRPRRHFALALRHVMMYRHRVAAL
jgi:hypothetical protein